MFEKWILVERTDPFKRFVSNVFKSMILELTTNCGKFHFWKGSISWEKHIHTHSFIHSQGKLFMNIAKISY